MMPYLIPLAVVWAVITLTLIILLVVRRRLESREQDWLPLNATEETIHNQEVIEKKVHKLTPVVHWLEAADVALLLIICGLWIYHGITSIRW